MDSRDFSRKENEVLMLLNEFKLKKVK
jgi:hypothetical protein